jgi:hypothetical protein
MDKDRKWGNIRKDKQHGNITKDRKYGNIKKLFPGRGKIITSS